MSVHPLPSASKVLSLLALAKKNRSVASTRLNKESSRSHSVFILSVRGVRYAKKKGSEASGGEDAEGMGEIVERCEGRLNLVDLAGSERVGTAVQNAQASSTGSDNMTLNLKAGGSGVEGERLKETQCINKSLSALGDVIAALGEQKGDAGGHVPYRNSKLTYLLQYSLGWRAKVLVGPF
jgi:kinesin family member C1